MGSGSRHFNNSPQKEIIRININCLLPLPIPASVYGFVLLFAGLMTGMIKLDMVKDAAKFLIEIMPLMFIPAGVGLICSWDVLRPILIPIAVITVVTTVVVMALSLIHI